MSKAMAPHHCQAGAAACRCFGGAFGCWKSEVLPCPSQNTNATVQSPAHLPSCPQHTHPHLNLRLQVRFLCLRPPHALCKIHHLQAARLAEHLTGRSEAERCLSSAVDRAACTRPCPTPAAAAGSRKPSCPAVKQQASIFIAASHLGSQRHDLFHLRVPLRRRLLLLTDQLLQVRLLCQPHRSALRGWVASCGIVWGRVALCGIVWDHVASCGIVWDRK
jgi:hypothetical protein